MTYIKTLSPMDSNRRQLKRPLRQALELLGVDSDLRLRSFESLAQELMERYVTKGTERWDEAEVVLSDVRKRWIFWSLMHRLHLYDEISPPMRLQSVDYLLLVAGSLRPEDRKNAHAIKLLTQGLEVRRHIAHLTGWRDLNSRIDDPALLSQHLPGGLKPKPGWTMPDVPYERERHMSQVLWERSQTPAITVPVLFPEAGLSTGHRAHTGDTFAAWLKQCSPKPGTALVVSVSPHTQFQYAAAVQYLVPAGFRVFMTAPSAALGPQDISYFTGAIARWLWWYGKAMELIFDE